MEEFVTGQYIPRINQKAVQTTEKIDLQNFLTRMNQVHENLCKMEQQAMQLADRAFGVKPEVDDSKDANTAEESLDNSIKYVERATRRLQLQLNRF